MTITPIPTLGGEETNEIHLDGVRVPEDALLGGEGAGWTQLMAGLNYERTILAASRARAGAAHVRRRARLRQGAATVRPPGRLLPGALAPLRRAGHRARPGAAARALGGRADRRGPEPDAAPGGLDGQAGGHRAGQALRARGHAGDGRLRLRHRVPDGALPARRPWWARSTAARRRSRRTSSPRRSGSEHQQLSNPRRVLASYLVRTLKLPKLPAD